MKFRTLFVAPASLLLLTVCRNPLLPPTGVPVNQSTEAPRATPQGVIDQLIDAYENRQIDLYIDLFPKDGSFRFFVAPSFVGDYKARAKDFYEQGDSLLQFVSRSELYYYWTQDKEVQGCTRLFTQAASIEFTEKPVLASVRKFIDNGDSVAEVLMTGGLLDIGQYTDFNVITIYPVEIERQVFKLEKDERNLWVISKWYDLGTSASGEE